MLSGGKQSTFLDIRSQVTSGSEQGLLSIAFPPDYASSGRFYVYFTDKSQDERVVEFKRASATRADPGSERARAADGRPGGQPQRRPAAVRPRQAHVHRHRRRRRRGRPARRRAATRRTSARRSARSCGSTRTQSGGKAYTVPSDNPFVDRAGARPEIYSYGLRNPWRYSFDRKTGDLIDRRRRPGRGRGDRLRPPRQGQGRELRLARRSRAARATRPARARPAQCSP